MATATTSCTTSLTLRGDATRTKFAFSGETRRSVKKLNFLLSHSPLVRTLLVKSSKFEALVDEEVQKIRRLQNGSDVRGVALEGEKGREVDLTPNAVESIAESFGEWLTDKLEVEHGRTVEGGVKVSVGRDPRISGARAALFSGLSRAGCIAFDMGLATTPACFMSTVLAPFQYDESIMIWNYAYFTTTTDYRVGTSTALWTIGVLPLTASHLPYTGNGLKSFTRGGGLTSPEVEVICDRAARKYANQQARASTSIPACPSRDDFMSVYSQHLRDIIKERVNHPLQCDTPLEGFQIIVNAGNGSGGFFTKDVIDKLGANTIGLLHLDPDGMFPNQIPNPEDKTAMALTRAAVLENSADLGIVFDTDVDCSGVVDSKGKPINGDKLIALMSA
ncbi:putative phosphoglucosamine mutase [Drosera capensis]